MSRFTAELKKNVIFFLRNLTFTLFIFGLPCVNLLLFYYANGGEPEGLSLAVVNNDQPSCVNYSYQPNICDLSNLSCNYLHHLKGKKLSLVDYKEVITAIDHAKNSHIWGVLHFSPDYSSALSARINEPLITDDAVVVNSSLIAYMDSSNNIIHDILTGKLRKSFLEMTRELHRACGYSVKLTKLPVKFEKPIYGKASPSFREFLAPALLTLLMFGMPLSYGFIIVEEKISGAASRSIIAGTTVFEILTAHVSLHVVIQLFQTFISMVMLFWILNFPLAKPFLSSILLFLQGLAGIAVSFCLCTLLNTELAVTSLNTAFVVVNVLLGGMIWPIEGIHPSIKLLSWITPITFATQSLRTLSIRGWDLTNKEVYLGFISTSSWIIVFTLITYICVKRNKGLLSKNM